MSSFTNKQLTNNLKITVEVIKATPITLMEKLLIEDWRSWRKQVQQQETIKMNQNRERNQKKTLTGQNS